MQLISDRTLTIMAALIILTVGAFAISEHWPGLTQTVTDTGAAKQLKPSELEARYDKLAAGDDKIVLFKSCEQVIGGYPTDKVLVIERKLVKESVDFPPSSVVCADGKPAAPDKIIYLKGNDGVGVTWTGRYETISLAEAKSKYPEIIRNARKGASAGDQK